MPIATMNKISINSFKEYLDLIDAVNETTYEIILFKARVPTIHYFLRLRGMIRKKYY